VLSARRTICDISGLMDIAKMLAYSQRSPYFPFLFGGRFNCWQEGRNSVHTFWQSRQLIAMCLVAIVISSFITPRYLFSSMLNKTFRQRIQVHRKLTCEPCTPCIYPTVTPLQWHSSRVCKAFSARGAIAGVGGGRRTLCGEEPYGQCWIIDETGEAETSGPGPQ